MPPDLYTDPLFAITLTVAVYAASLEIHRHLKSINPFLLTLAILFAILLPSRIPMAAYQEGAKLITFFLGPATVALAVPLYKNARHIKAAAAPILLALLAGSLTAITTAGLTAWLLHAPRLILVSILPKSVTTPVALGIVRQFVQSPSLRPAAETLTAFIVCLTGTLGVLIGPRFLKLLGITHDIPLGLAMGTSSHGIGTASLLPKSQLQGSAAALAMALNAILTPILMIPLYPHLKL